MKKKPTKKKAPPSKLASLRTELRAMHADLRRALDERDEAVDKCDTATQRVRELEDGATGREARVLAGELQRVALKAGVVIETGPCGPQLTADAIIAELTRLRQVGLSALQAVSNVAATVTGAAHCDPAERAPEKPEAPTEIERHATMGKQMLLPPVKSVAFDIFMRRMCPPRRAALTDPAPRALPGRRDRYTREARP